MPFIFYHDFVKAVAHPPSLVYFLAKSLFVPVMETNARGM